MDLDSGGAGLGKVYQIRAKDSRDGTVYACKVLRQSRDSDISAEREAVLTISRGHHPNIVEVIDTVYLDRVGVFVHHTLHSNGIV